MGFFEQFSKMDPVGSKIGAFAEEYMASDTNASMIKQGMLLEYIITQYLKARGIYDEVPKKPNKPYIDLDDMLSFLETDLNNINPNMYKLCDEIRINRNKAAHKFFEDEFAPSNTLPILQSVYKYIVNYLYKNRHYTNFLLGIGYVFFCGGPDGIHDSFHDIDEYYGPTKNPAVDAFELAFKNAVEEY